MPLKNSQYNAIMRSYDEKQARSHRDLEERKAELHARFPRLREIRDGIAANAVARARAKITGDDAGLKALTRESEDLKKEQAALYAQAGLGPEGLKPRHVCPLCGDTGFVNGAKCKCFIQAAVDLLYDQSNIRDILEKENFSTLSMKYYSREAADGKRSQHDIMKERINWCRRYVDRFDKDHGSILFCGPTGVGKTFLSNCIAKALIDSCHSVVYFSAIDFFDLFSRASFDADEEERDQADQYVLESDLLIIDDLGSECINRFTVEKLFYTVNERLVRRKSTIISTNLTPGALRDEYTERIASRILSNYEPIQLTGEDIRIRKKYG